MTEDSAAADDRRRAPRVDLQAGSLRVVLPSLAEFLRMYARNISASGMFVAIDTPPAVGTRIRFRFEIAGEREAFEGNGEVVWARAAADSGSPGMGVRFFELSPAAQELIRNIVHAQRRDLLKPR